MKMYGNLKLIGQFIADLQRGGTCNSSLITCCMSFLSGGQLSTDKQILQFVILFLVSLHVVSILIVPYPGCAWFKCSTGWFFETDIFKFFISQNVKASEKSNHMENSPNKFPFWYLVSQKFHNFLVIIHLWRLLRQVIERIWKLHWKLMIFESQYNFANISATKAPILMKFLT